jgi:hypothetical protein
VDDSTDVSLLEGEHVDRQAVVHAERERRRVHHLEAALDRLEVRQLREQRGIWVDPRVAVQDAFDGVLGHQDPLGADLQRAQRGSRVGREERVARAGREDDDASLLEVPDRPAADIRLGDLRCGQCGEHPRVRATALERVLERERVQERREHARVVGGRTVHALRGRLEAAVDVPGAHDDRELEPLLLHVDDLTRECGDAVRVEPVLLLAHEGLAGELQQHPAKGGARRVGPSFSGRDRFGHSASA